MRTHHQQRQDAEQAARHPLHRPHPPQAAAAVRRRLTPRLAPDHGQLHDEQALHSHPHHIHVLRRREGGPVSSEHDAAGSRLAASGQQDHPEEPP